VKRREIAVAKELLAKNVPEDEIDEMVKAFEKLGATEVKKVENEDGTFDLEGTFPD
jgi:hypothetical protein